MGSLKSLSRDDSGAAAVQHALVIGVVSLAVLAGSLALGGSLGDLYGSVGDQANAALVTEPAAESEADDEG